MGTNNKYADPIEQHSLEKFNQRNMVREPESLSRFEVDLKNDSVTYTSKPKKVWFVAERSAPRVWTPAVSMR